MPRHPRRLQLVDEQLALLHDQAVLRVGSPGPYLGHAPKSQEALRTSQKELCLAAVSHVGLENQMVDPFVFWIQNIHLLS